jgi:hypothetical protein
MQHADTLLSSSALRNFRRVINELRGIEDDPDGRRRALVSSLRMSVVGNDLSVPSPCNPPKPTVQSNIIPVHPQLMYEEQQEVERPPHCMIYQTLPTPPCSSLRPLEQEFVGLLLQRAVDEEADAEELRMLSGRLDRLALARKNLADYIKKYERH